MPASYYLIIIGAGLLALIWVIIQFRDTSEQEGSHIIEQLDAEIDRKEKQLIQLENEIRNVKVNKNVNISESFSQALDTYETNGIRIPADIIEDGSQLSFRSKESALNYIESQRANWKMENGKKLYKGME